MTKHCMPFMERSENPHVLNISPPLNMDSKWFINNVAYTVTKYSVSMQVLGLSEEFKNRIAFNALWPRTIIDTSAL